MATCTSPHHAAAQFGKSVSSMTATDGTVPEAGYRTMYGVVGACVAASLLVYARTSDAKPSSGEAVA